VSARFAQPSFHLGNVIATNSLNFESSKIVRTTALGGAELQKLKTWYRAANGRSD